MTLEPDKTLLRLETQRSGPFTFQLGCKSQAIETLLLRVDDAYQRFRGAPLAQVANLLEKEVVVSSIFGTNSIEGGTLSEEETGRALELDPQRVQDVEQRRALNLKAAYDLSRQVAQDPDRQLDILFIKAIHAAITDQLPHKYNQPGLLRDNQKAIVTHVGNAAHGGQYKPPQYGQDINRLLEGLVTWNQQLTNQKVSVLLRAPLIHYYYELIHPFWDGNGRVGRVLEATILQTEGYQYAPFTQAHYYFSQIDRYVTLFNHCRKSAKKKQSNPNAPFVEFFLEGMLISLNKLHSRVNQIVNQLLFENDLKRRHDEKEINTRQYAVVTQVLNAGNPLPLAKLRQAPWYLALYTERTDKTKQRDLQKLRDQQLLILDAENRLWPGFIQPGPEQHQAEAE